MPTMEEARYVARELVSHAMLTMRERGYVLAPKETYGLIETSVHANVAEAGFREDILAAVREYLPPMD